MKDTVLSISDLFVIFSGNDHPSLKNINLEVKENQVILISGPNGSGKTTLLRSIIRLFNKGSIKKATGNINLLMDCTIVLQRPKAQLFTFSVAEEVATPLSFSRIQRKIRIKKVEEHLSKFNKLDLMHIDPRNISSGQQQVVVTLTSIISEKPLILLDEPFSLLDSENANIFLELLHDLKLRGYTIVIVDHNPLRYNSLIDRHIVLEKGIIKSINNFEKIEEKIISAHIDELFTYSPNKAGITIGFDKPLFTFPLRELSGFILVTGANGSGKTALLKTLAGIIPPFNGKIKGEDYFFVPQDATSFFWKKSVLEEIGSLKSDWVIPFLDKSPFDLSGGELKRLSLMIAFSYSTTIILDEPTQSLDEQNTAWLIDYLSIKSQYKCILLSSNDGRFITKIASLVDNHWRIQS